MAILALGLICLLPTSNRAQADSPSPTELEAARLHYESAAQYKRDGDAFAARGDAKTARVSYGLAARNYLEAYRRSGGLNPKMLYDLAQVYRLRGEYAWALQAYRKYIAEEPDGSEVPHARHAIAELEAVLNNRAASGAPAADVDAADPTLEPPESLWDPRGDTAPARRDADTRREGDTAADSPSRLSSRSDQVASAASPDREATDAAREGPGASPSPTDADVEQREPGDDRPSRWSRHVRAGLAYDRTSQDFTSDDVVNQLGNYGVSNGIVSLVLTGEMDYRHESGFLFGAEASYAGTLGAPTVTCVPQVCGVMTDIEFSVREFAIAGRIGREVSARSGLRITGRAGYYNHHHAITHVDDFARNPALFPTENLAGLIVGGQVDVPRITSRVGLRLDISTLLLSEFDQTDGLEDGEAVDQTGALWLGARLVYRLRPNLGAELGYRYTRVAMDWSSIIDSPTPRHAASFASRTDTGHLLGVGVGVGF